MILWEIDLITYKPRPQKFTALTWSWASQMSRVWFRKPSDLAFDLLHAEVQLTSSDPYGQVKSGTLSLSGLLIVATVQIRKPKSCDLHQIKDGEKVSLIARVERNKVAAFKF
jgi:hypothetical protein